MKKLMGLLAALLFLFSVASGQSSGNFTISQSVVAGGGGQNAAGGAFSLDGTIGQAVAGNALNGLPFALTSGFWNFSPIAPTAASVSVGGRVMTTSGRGIRNVLIVMTGADGTIRTATSTNFGFYRFTDVAAGETYIFTARGKRFLFTEPTRVISVLEDITNLDFIAGDKENLKLY